MTSREHTAPANPLGPAPPRLAASIRRTSTIDTSWPAGVGQPMHMRGLARDLLTPGDSAAPRVLAEDSLDVMVTPARQILDISCNPPRDAIAELVGCRGGGHLRAVLQRLLPEERQRGTPLYLLLDDLSGASLVAGWSWSVWLDDWQDQLRASGAMAAAGRKGTMAGICIGYRPGSSSLTADGEPDHSNQSRTAVPSLESEDDPLGWHKLSEPQGMAMRRARRIDVRVDDVIHMDIAFQDSSTAPGGGRLAIHEYRVWATAARHSFELLSVTVEPRILPFWECRAAAPNASRMVGTRLPDMRTRVPEILPGTAGCTHLNDVLRSMAEVPLLSSLL